MINKTELRAIIFKAGIILKSRYYSSFSVHEKEKGHLAADAELEVEIYLKEQLKKLDASIGFYGEESGGDEESQQRWIVDSLDGTANFIFGVPYFCTSIALEKNRKIVCGLVYCPITEELFEAYEDENLALCNGKEMHVSTISKLIESKVVFGFSANFKNIIRYHSEWGNVFDGCLKGMGLLSPALNLCNVARGRTEAFIDFGASMEGQAAGGFILQKAGGKLSNYDRSPWNHYETGIISTNENLEVCR